MKAGIFYIACVTNEIGGMSVQLHKDPSVESETSNQDLGHRMIYS